MNSVVHISLGMDAYLSVKLPLVCRKHWVPKYRHVTRADKLDGG